MRNGPANHVLEYWGYEKNMAVCQNLVPLVNIKIAGKWMFIPLKIVLIGIDPYPYDPQKMGYRKIPRGES